MAAATDGKGLADWDISRDAPYFGIPIPDAPGKYFYVWLDAPVGYLASLKSTSIRSRSAIGDTRRSRSSSPTRTSSSIHFIGKDIVYFHTLFWPAMLEFAGAPYKVPDNVFVHGFITFSGEKMSKSRGTGISPRALPRSRPQSRVAALLHRGQAQRAASRTSTSIPTISSRASTATSIGKYVNIASRAATFITQALRRQAGDADGAGSRARAIGSWTIAQLEAGGRAR